MTITVNENNKTFPITLLTSELFKANENNDKKIIEAKLNEDEIDVCWRALFSYGLKHEEDKEITQKLCELFCIDEEDDPFTMSIVRKIKRG